MIWRRRWSVSKYRQGNNAKKPKRFRTKIKLVKWYDDEETVGFLYLGKDIYRYIERYYYSFYAIGIKDCWQWLLAFLLNTKWHHYDENLPFSLLFLFYSLLGVQQEGDGERNHSMNHEPYKWCKDIHGHYKKRMNVECIIRDTFVLFFIKMYTYTCRLIFSHERVYLGRIHFPLHQHGYTLNNQGPPRVSISIKEMDRDIRK